jgi:hypothetical protein
VAGASQCDSTLYAASTRSTPSYLKEPEHSKKNKSIQLDHLFRNRIVIADVLVVPNKYSFINACPITDLVGACSLDFVGREIAENLWVYGTCETREATKTCSRGLACSNGSSGSGALTAH